MTTTTAAILRALIAARILALTPTKEPGRSYLEHDYLLPLSEWALAHPTACLRRFSVLEDPDVSEPDVTDGSTEGVWQTFTIAVAYPKSWRFGDQGLVDLFNTLAADRLQIVKTVGTVGFATLATTTQAATVQTASEAREDLGPVVFATVRLRAFYYRSVA